MKSIILSMALFAIVANAQEDYTTWGQHKDWWTNTQPNGADVANRVTNFPVLVRLDSTNFGTGFAQSVGRGADLRFTKANNATRLPHQIERWDSAGKKAEVWVLLDSIPGGATKAFRMHWAKTGVADSSRGSSVFRTANGFQAVWHMNGSTNETDATANNLTATQTGSPASVNGPIGLARNIANTGTTASMYFTVANSATVLQNPNGSNFTLSAWANLNRQNANATLMSKHDLAWAMKLDGNSNWETFAYDGASWNCFRGPSEAGVWHHILGVINGADVTASALYIDGVHADGGLEAIAGTNARNDAIDLVIGTEPQTATTFRRPFDGMADELRVAGVLRNADWARLEYQNQRPTGQSLVAWTQPVAIGAGSASQGAGFSMAPSGEGLAFRVQGVTTRARAVLMDLQGRIVWARTGNIAGGTLTWNGRLPSGALAPSGIYALRISFLDGERVVETLDRQVPFTR